MSQCLLEEYDKDNGNVRFDTHRYHCLRETHFTTIRFVPLNVGQGHEVTVGT